MLPALASVLAASTLETQKHFKKERGTTAVVLWSQDKDVSQKGLPVTRSCEPQPVLSVNELLAGDNYYSAPAFGSWEPNSDVGPGVRAMPCRHGKECLCLQNAVV